MIERDAEGNAVDPAPEGVGVAGGSGPSGHLEKRFLRRVFGILGAPKNLEAGVVNSMLVGDQEGAKRVARSRIAEAAEEIFFVRGHHTLNEAIETLLTGYYGAMKPTSLERALAAMESIMPGEPYALKPGDPKRKLIEVLARLSRELKIKPVVIGGLAVNHHGYLRVTVDVDLLLSREDALKLHRRLKEELGWKRHGEGFKNVSLGVGVDFCVEGGIPSPQWAERFPHPSKLALTRSRPLPVPALPVVLALKTMSGRAKDEGDAVELLKRHPKRIDRLVSSAAALLATEEARASLANIAVRAREELARRS